MKKVKAPPLDVKKLLASLEPEQVASRVRGKEDAIDALYELLLDMSTWELGDLQMRAVAVLCALGESEEVVDVFLVLVDDLGLDDGGLVEDDDLDVVLGRIAVGSDGAPISTSVISSPTRSTRHWSRREHRRPAGWRSSRCS